MSNSSWPAWTNQPIKLYHGTSLRSAHEIMRNGVDVARGRPNLDFGQGFYTTTLLKQASERADDMAIRKRDLPAVILLSVDRLVLRDLRSLSFVQGTQSAEDYWSFVSHCRSRAQSHPRTEDYFDVVYGPVASAWFSPSNSRVRVGYDQVSFHSRPAETMLRNPIFCKLEVLK